MPGPCTRTGLIISMTLLKSIRSEFSMPWFSAEQAVVKLAEQARPKKFFALKESSFRNISTSSNELLIRWDGNASLVDPLYHDYFQNTILYPSDLFWAFLNSRKPKSSDIQPMDLFSLHDFVKNILTFELTVIMLHQAWGKFFRLNQTQTRARYIHSKCIYLKGRIRPGLIQEICRGIF